MPQIISAESIGIGIYGNARTDIVANCGVEGGVCRHQSKTNPLPVEYQGTQVNALCCWAVALQGIFDSVVCLPQVIHLAQNQ